MSTIKEALGFLATCIALASYVPYIKDVLANRTKPHAYTWLVWGTLALIGFLSQIADNAGPGAWPTGITTLICFVILILSLIKGRNNIVKLDFVMLSAAALVLVVWHFTKQPNLSIILVTLVDMLGFIPTVRKSWIKPYEETLSAFVLSDLKHILSLLALVNYSLVTTLYPSYLLVANTLFLCYLLIRRRAMRNVPPDTREA